MAWLAVNNFNDEILFSHKPHRNDFLGDWCLNGEIGEHFIALPEGSIKKLIGRELTWEDEPVEIS